MALGTVVGAIGAIVLTGWLLGVPALRGAIAGQPAMSVTAAVAFMLIGFAVTLLARASAAWARATRRVAAVVVFALGLLTLLDYAPLGERVPPATALGLVTGAGAFLLLDIGRAGAVGQILALATGTLGFFHLVGYAYLDRVGEVSQYAVVALHTAIPLVLMSTGILLARPDRGLMRLAHADTRAGVIVRRLLPMVIAAPFVVGWIVDEGRRAGLYGPELAMAVSVAGTVVALAAVVWAAAAALQRADVHRRRAETALQRADAEVDRVVARALELTDANKVLVEMAARLRTLNRLNRLVSSSLDFEAVLVAISRAAADITDTPVVSFWLADEASRKLTVGAWSDAAVGADFPSRRLTFGEGAVGVVASTRQPLHVPDVFATSSPSVAARDWCARHGLPSFYGVPVFAQDRLLAVLALSRRTPFVLGEEDQELLGSFVAQAAIAIDNARLFAETQHRRAMAEAAETRYRELFDRNLAGIFRASRDGRILECNEAMVRILGYASREEVMGLRAEDLYADPRERESVAFPRRAGERLSNAELRWRRADGSAIAVLVNVAGREGGGEEVVLEGIVVDITDRERAAAAESEAETLRAVAKLANAAAHEINNPLAVIVAHLDLLAKRHEGDPDTQQRVDRARVACRRIAEMIIHMGRITRLEILEQSPNLPPILDLRRSSGEAESS